MTSTEFQSFVKIRDYPWASNLEFQSGLRSILSNSPPSTHEELTNRAKCFYFQKKTGIAVNDMAYTEWLESSPALTPTPTPAAISGVDASNILSQPSVPAALPASVIDGTAAIPAESALGATDEGAATGIPTAAAGTPAMTATAISPTPNPTPVMPSSPAPTPAPMQVPPMAVAPGAAEDGDAPYPKSFAEMVELITLGKPIPGIKEIPDTVLDEPENPGVQRRKKPWEKE
ncbi:hypothetical protein BZA77DRAFT_305260 [Pyronema omphalodes]|nr:hypothetical protein BZA77DRAFT_305260 [Pyronema omphalodes]